MSYMNDTKRYQILLPLVLAFVALFASRPLAAQGHDTAAIELETVPVTKSPGHPSPVPAGPAQPTMVDQIEFVKSYAALNEKKKVMDIDLDKFDAAKKFSDDFAQLLKDTKNTALGVRLAAIYKQVSNAKIHHDRLVLAITEAKAINIPLTKLMALWSSFKLFADHDFKDIKDPVKELIDDLKSFNKLDKDRLTVLAGSAGDIASIYDKSLSDSHQSLVEAINAAIEGFDALSKLPEDASDSLLRSSLEKSLDALTSAVSAAATGKDMLGKIEVAYKISGLPTPIDV